MSSTRTVSPCAAVGELSACGVASADVADVVGGSEVGGVHCVAAERCWVGVVEVEQERLFGAGLVSGRVVDGAFGVVADPAGFISGRAFCFEFASFAFVTCAVLGHDPPDGGGLEL